VPLLPAGVLLALTETPPVLQSSTEDGTSVVSPRVPSAATMDSTSPASAAPPPGAKAAANHGSAATRSASPELSPHLLVQASLAANTLSPLAL